MTLNWTATDDEDTPIWKAETEAGTYEAGYDGDAWASFDGKRHWSFYAGSNISADDAKAIAEAIHAITQ